MMFQAASRWQGSKTPRTLVRGVQVWCECEARWFALAHNVAVVQEFDGFVIFALFPHQRIKPNSAFPN